jgi:1-acylglycerone phosphate reductase
MNPRSGQKTVLITGCSKGGIGDALARAFHGKGFKVFASARNLSKISHLKAIGISVLILDIVDPSSVRNAVEVIKTATGGTLDILVNNAGVGKIITLLSKER